MPPWRQDSRRPCGGPRSQAPLPCTKALWPAMHTAPMARAPLTRRALLLGLLVASAAEARPASRFAFKPPVGWTDLLDNPPEEAITSLHPALALQMLRDDLLALA